MRNTNNDLGVFHFLGDVRHRIATQYNKDARKLPNEDRECGGWPCVLSSIVSEGQEHIGRRMFWRC